jgi:ABC-type dipeptide/oligopeptide/nickel transport system permease component
VNRALWRYVGLRTLAIPPVLLGTSIVTFAITHMLGNPVYLLLGPTATPQAVKSTTEKLLLDRPIWEQYVHYLQGLARGDLGESWFTGRPVLQDLSDRFPMTFELVSLALLVAIVLGVALGTLAAAYRGGAIDQVVRLVTILGVSIPNFWLGLILIFVFFFLLKWAPAPLGELPIVVSAPPRVTGMVLLDSVLAGNWQAATASASRLVLPVLAVAFGVLGPIARQSRAATLDVLDSEFVYYARCCGLAPSRLWLAILRNACLPVVTLAGVLYGLLLGGAALVEVVFAWGGLGQYAVQSMVQNDFPAIQGVVQLTAAFSILVYLLIDVIYVLVDPRIAYQ